LYVESAILDDFSAYRGGLGNGYAGGQVLAEFYPEDQYGGNSTNWWVPTLHCLGFMARAAGFPIVEGWKLVDQPGTLSLCRGFVRASKYV
jgi:tRNA (mo5U34)-methyltransferase